MRIHPADLKEGDIVVWKGGGPFYQVLSWILIIFDKKSGWDRWGWHTGFVIDVRSDGAVSTCQAVTPRLCVVNYPSLEAMGNFRAYRWLDKIDSGITRAYLAERIGWYYDPFVYFWTLFEFFWNFRISNKKLMCWENVSEYCDRQGKPLQEDYEPCILSRMIRKMEDYQPG